MNREIQERLDCYVAAVNGGDADAAAEAWRTTASSSFPVPLRPWAVRDPRVDQGRPADVAQLELQSVDVLVEGNVVIDTGTWSVKLQTPDGPVEDGGPAVRVWCRGTDGVWRLYRDIWNSEQPPEPG